MCLVGSAYTLRHFNQERGGRWTKALGLANLIRHRFVRSKPQIGPIQCSDNATQHSRNNNDPNSTGPAMSLFVRFSFAFLIAMAPVLASQQALAQSGDAKSGDKPAAAQAVDPAKEAQRQADEFAEASRLVTGPAGNPECVWLGRRVVGLMWRDDMDTAFRHLDLYDRFGCPGPHIQTAFRCVVRQGNIIDPKSPQSLNARVHACWLNPSASQTAGGPPASSGPAQAASAPAAANSAAAATGAGTPSKEGR
jgi:hypothetical protein